MSSLVLNCDAGLSDGVFSIGVVLRQKPPRTTKPLQVIAYISRTIGQSTVSKAEYRALIEGLKLAGRYDLTTLQVFTDSMTVARQINDSNPRFASRDLEPLWKETWREVDRLGIEREHVTISWVPREMNQDADRRTKDAFLNRVNGAQVRPAYK